MTDYIRIREPNGMTDWQGLRSSLINDATTFILDDWLYYVLPIQKGTQGGVPEFSLGGSPGDAFSFFDTYIVDQYSWGLLSCPFIYHYNASIRERYEIGGLSYVLLNIQGHIDYPTTLNSLEVHQFIAANLFAPLHTLIVSLNPNYESTGVIEYTYSVTNRIRETIRYVQSAQFPDGGGEFSQLVHDMFVHLLDDPEMDPNEVPSSIVKVLKWMIEFVDSKKASSGSESFCSLS
jgi:hypothetical protein